MSWSCPKNAVLPAMDLVGTSRPVRQIAKGLAMALLVAVILLAFVPWQQSILGHGRVIAFTPVERQQTIAAPVDGRVVRWHVVEGSVVKEGDLIVEVSDNDPAVLDRLQSELAAARERVQSLTDRILGIEVSRDSALAAADARVSMAAERARAAEGALEASEATRVAARLNYDRQQQLHERGLASTRNLEVARMEHDRAVAEVDRSRAALNAARDEQEATLSDRRKAAADYTALLEDARASRAVALGAILPIETRLARQTTQEIRAPRDGIILRMLAQPGSELLKMGEPLAILVPESTQTVVELWVNGNDMPLLHAGDKVRLQFEGWPAIQFVGWPSVAVGTFGGMLSLVDATDDGNGRFRILVSPDPDDPEWPPPQYLRQGVRANGWVLLKQVSLWFELWRQFNGFPPTSPYGPPKPESQFKVKRK